MTIHECDVCGKKIDIQNGFRIDMLRVEVFPNYTRRHPQDKIQERCEKIRIQLAVDYCGFQCFANRTKEIYAMIAGDAELKKG